MYPDTSALSGVSGCSRKRKTGDIGPDCGETEEHMTLLRRLIKFVIQTRDRGIRVKPLTEDEGVAFDDSDFAGDKENRHENETNRHENTLRAGTDTRR
jgi:hypothetical protein